MEKKLESLFNLNEKLNNLNSLVNLNKDTNKKKQKIRKKLYEKIFDMYYIEFNSLEKELFQISSIEFRDKEYDELRINYCLI